MNLRQLQNDFQSYLFHYQGPALSQIVSDDKAAADVRLAIYADGYRLRLLEALETDFPALHTLLGDSEFEMLGRAYIDAHPSQHFSVRYFAAQLPAFLAHAAPYCDTPIVSEMAAFEWALRNAFDAADSQPVTLTEMAIIPPESWGNMRFYAQASVCCLHLRWNAPTLWKAINNNESDNTDYPAPTQADLPVTWLIWRRDLQNYFRSLSIDEANVALHAAGLLKQWITDGLVDKIMVTP